MIRNPAATADSPGQLYLGPFGRHGHVLSLPASSLAKPLASTAAVRGCV
jgi:hypothetical protein